MGTLFWDWKLRSCITDRILSSKWSYMWSHDRILYVRFCEWCFVKCFQYMCVSKREWCFQYARYVSNLIRILPINCPMPMLRLYTAPCGMRAHWPSKRRTLFIDITFPIYIFCPNDSVSILWMFSIYKKPMGQMTKRPNDRSLFAIKYFQSRSYIFS